MYYKAFLLGFIACLTLIRVPPASSLSCAQCNTGEDCVENKDSKVVDCPTSKGCYAFFKAEAVEMKGCMQEGSEFEHEECRPNQGGSKCYCTGDKCNDGMFRCYNCTSGDACREPNLQVAYCRDGSKGCFTKTREDGAIIAKYCAKPEEEYKENGCQPFAEPGEPKDVQKCFCTGDKCNNALPGAVKPVEVEVEVTTLRHKKISKRCFVCEPCPEPFTHSEECMSGQAPACITEAGPDRRITRQYCAEPGKEIPQDGCTFGADGSSECACFGSMCNDDTRSGRMANSTDSSQGLTLQIGRLTALPTLWMMGRPLF